MRLHYLSDDFLKGFIYGMIGTATIFSLAILTTLVLQ